MSVHLPVLFRERENWKEAELTSQQRAELVLESSLTYSSPIKERGRTMSFNVPRRASNVHASDLDAVHANNQAAASAGGSGASATAAANASRLQPAHRDTVTPQEQTNRAQSGRRNVFSLTALGSTDGGSRVGTATSARATSSRHHKKPSAQLSSSTSVTHNHAVASPYVAFNSTVSQLPEFLSPPARLVARPPTQQQQQQQRNDIVGGFESAPMSPHIQINGEATIATNATAPRGFAPSRGTPPSSSGAGGAALAMMADSRDVYDLTHMSPTSKRIGYLVGGGPGGMTPRGVLRHSIRSPLDQAVWKAPPPRRVDRALEHQQDVQCVKALDDFDVAVPVGSVGPAVPQATPAALASQQQKQRQLHLHQHMDDDASRAGSPNMMESPAAANRHRGRTGNAKGAAVTGTARSHRRHELDSSSSSSDEPDDGGAPGSSGHHTRHRHHLRAQTHMHDGAESPLPFVAIMQGLFPSVSPQQFLQRYIRFVQTRRPRSPVLWTSLVPTEDLLARQSSREHIGSNPLYVAAVTHEDHLFKALLADLSSAPLASFTDGFCRTVLAALAEHDTAAFDSVVVLVSDQCRKNELAQQASAAGAVANPSAPPPRSQLVQTKAMFQEAEVLQRERRLRDDMLAGSVSAGQQNQMPSSPSSVSNGNAHQAKPQTLSGHLSSDLRRSPSGSNVPVSLRQSRSRSNSFAAAAAAAIANGPGNSHASASNFNGTQRGLAPSASTAGFGAQVLTIRDVFRAFTDATLEPVALRNVMVVVEQFDPHGVGFVPHYAFTAKHFLLRYFYKTVPHPTLSEKANWENVLNTFERVRAETEQWVRTMEARGSDNDSSAPPMPIFAWYLAALVGPRVCPPSGGQVRAPLELLSALFAKHYDRLPPPVPVPLSDFRFMLLVDDRVVSIMKHYTIPAPERSDD